MNTSVLQEFYDSTITHLLKQGRQAYGLIPSYKTSIPRCLYRAPDGLSCAAGYHIPDDKYSQEMEGMSIRRVIVEHPSLNEHFPSVDLAVALQAFHDSYGSSTGPDFIDPFLRDNAQVFLDGVASDYDLKTFTLSTHEWVEGAP